MARTTKEVSCPGCQETFTERRTLYRHQRSTARCSKNKFRVLEHGCRFCTRRFARRDTLVRHERERHLKIPRFSDFPKQMSGISRERVVITGPTTQDHRSRWNDGGNKIARLEASSRAHETACGNPSTDVNKPSAAPIWSLDDLGASEKLCDAILADSPWLFEYMNISRARLAKLGASGRMKNSRMPKCCPLCRRSFGDFAQERLAHIRRHVEDLKSLQACNRCGSLFMQKADLSYHQTVPGNCSAEFATTEQLKANAATERAITTSAIQLWEHIQLVSYRIYIESLEAEWFDEDNADCWSVAGSVKTFYTTFSRASFRSIPRSLQMTSLHQNASWSAGGVHSIRAIRPTRYIVRLSDSQKTNWRGVNLEEMNSFASLAINVAGRSDPKQIFASTGATHCWQCNSMIHEEDGPLCDCSFEKRSGKDDSMLPVEESQQRTVDFFDHDWIDEDLWASWKSLASQKESPLPRHKNAAWRIWAQNQQRLKRISPERLNWLKSSDVTYLYGPLKKSPSHLLTYREAQEAAPSSVASLKSWDSTLVHEKLSLPQYLCKTKYPLTRASLDTLVSQATFIEPGTLDVSQRTVSCRDHGKAVSFSSENAIDEPSTAPISSWIDSSATLGIRV